MDRHNPLEIIMKRTKFKIFVKFPFKTNISRQDFKHCVKTKIHTLIYQTDILMI